MLGVGRRGGDLGKENAMGLNDMALTVDRPLRDEFRFTVSFTKKRKKFKYYVVKVGCKNYRCANYLTVMEIFVAYSFELMNNEAGLKERFKYLELRRVKGEE
jgi:hypothetical protein